MVGRPARRPDRTTAVNSGRRRRRACAGNTSGGELLATLATTAGEDRAARTGAHPQPEAVGLGPTTVVRLERALAHEELHYDDDRRCAPAGRRAAAGGRRTAPHSGTGSWSLRTDRTARRMTGARSPPRSAGTVHRPGQHSRARGGCRWPVAIADRPWSPTAAVTAGGAQCAARDAPGRRAGPGLGVVAGLWTGLLASPSLRVGLQGPGAWAGPVGRPTAVPPAVRPTKPLTCIDMRIGAGTGAVLRHRPAPSVHTLWTPVWTCASARSTGARRRSDDRSAGDAGNTGRPGPAADRGRQQRRTTRHGRRHAGPGDGLGPDPGAAGHQPVPAAERHAQPDPTGRVVRGHRGARGAERVHPDRARVADAPGARRGPVGAASAATSGSRSRWRTRPPRPRGSRRTRSRSAVRGAPSTPRARRGGPGEPRPGRRRPERVRRPHRRRCRTVGPRRRRRAAHPARRRPAAARRPGEPGRRPRCTGGLEHHHLARRSRRDSGPAAPAIARRVLP